MAKQKNLDATVRLNGQVGSGFKAIIGAVTEMSRLTDRMNERLIQFGKDSVDVYRNYEDNILDAKGALSAQYKGAGELNRVMAKLEEHAAKWASTTIFHTDDVSRAIAEASHAGYSLEKQLDVIPRAMLVAQAGGMELSDALDDLIKMMNATKTPFEETATVVDEWVYASNRSATNISEMGEAFKALGASAMFADSTAELFTMMATLADVGTVGSQAGTMIRNSMIRLIAPTKKASEAMEDLMVTDEELADVAVNLGALEEANKLLEETGFDAYDSRGKLKPFLRIYKDLYKAVSGMEEVDRNKVLSAIFPTRTISTAMALLEGAQNDFNGLYQELVEDSEGYAQQVSDIMMSGLTGSTETLASKWEEFQRRVGATIAGPLEEVQGWLGGFVDNLNTMPQEKLEALVTGLTSLVAGTTVTTGAVALLKALAALGPMGGGMLAAAGAISIISGAITYLNAVDEKNFENMFGDMELDVESLSEALYENRRKWSQSRAAIERWDKVIGSGLENYRTLTSELSQGMLNAALSGQALTEEEERALTDYGTAIGDAVLAGIMSAQARDLDMLDYLFGNMGSPAEARMLENALESSQKYYEGLSEEASAVGQKLREQLVEALTDHKLDAHEREAVVASWDRLNEIMAEISGGLDDKGMQLLLRKASRVSWDSAAGFLEEAGREYEAQLETIQNANDEAYVEQQRKYKWLISHAETPDEAAAYEAEWAGMQGILDEMHKANVRQLDEDIGNIAGALFDTMMQDSGFSEGWAYLNGRTEGINPDRANEQLSGIVNDQDRFLGLLAPFEGSAWADRYIGMIKGAGSAAQAAAQQSTNDYMNQAAAEMAAEYIEARNAKKWEEAAASYRGTESDANIPGMDMSIRYENDEQSLAAAVAEGQDYADRHPIRAVWTTDLMGGGINRKSPTFLGDAYAEGGRATEPSVFGEEGAEWAIPEEHSARTADLLNAARAASGFTWGDLIGRYGGLNGAAGGVMVPINYSPTIYAGDAAGVDMALARDKERMRKAIRDALDDLKLTGAVAAFA